LIAPNRGMSSTVCGSINPYAATTITSGSQCFSRSTVRSSFRLEGWQISIPCSRANRLTAECVLERPRPEGRSGWLSTPVTWCLDSTSAARQLAANSGVPANTTFKAATPKFGPPRKTPLAPAGLAEGGRLWLRPTCEGVFEASP